MKILLTSAAAILLFAACDVKDPIYETDHPEHGKITLITDWTNRAAGIDILASYTVAVGDYSATVSGEKNVINNLFLPATYRAYIYNTPDNVTVGGTTAGVTAATAPDGASGTFINALPGWFFSCALDAKIEADTDHEFTAIMRQQVKEISFTITPSGGTADRIESITATLGGVAGAMNMDTGERLNASTVAMTFVKQADGKWKATIRLLGIVGNSQPLTTTIKFIDGEPEDITDTTDINDELDGDGDGDIDDDGSDGDLDLGTEIIETPTGAGFSATINDWKSNNGGSAIAN